MIPQGYKHTELGVIPQEWEVKQLVECFDISAGRDLIKECFSETPTVDCQFPIFSNSLENKGLYGYTSKPRHKAGCVTITGRGALGVAEYREEDFDAIVRLLVLSPKVEIGGKFVSEYINYRKPFFFESTGVPQLTAPQISKTLIPVPPMAEQRKIAEVLGVWDKAIELQTRLIDKLELRKRALMQRLLSGRHRLPGFSAPWQKVKLGDIGTFDKGYGVPKNKITTVGKKAITYGEIYTKYDFVIKDFHSYIDSITANESKEISCGAILFAGSGETLEDIGKCVAFIDNDVAYVGGDIIIFNPTIKVNSLLLSYILNSPFVNSQKREYGQGHSVVHVYAKDLSRIKLPLPPFDEQNAIVEVLTAADKQLEIAKAKLAAYRTQKRGLMQQLLTGKKRVK